MPPGWLRLPPGYILGASWLPSGCLLGPGASRCLGKPSESVPRGLLVDLGIFECIFSDFGVAPGWLPAGSQMLKWPKMLARRLPNGFRCLKDMEGLGWSSAALALQYHGHMRDKVNQMMCDLKRKLHDPTFCCRVASMTLTKYHTSAQKLTAA